MTAHPTLQPGCPRFRDAASVPIGNSRWSRTKKATSRTPRKASLLPIAVFLCYLTLTLALFAFGPWTWQVASPATLYGYVLANHLALLAGYLSAIGGEPRLYKSRARPELLFKIGVVTSIVLAGLRYVERSSGGIGLAEGLSDPGQVYLQVTSASDSIVAGMGLLSGYAEVYGQMLFGPLTALVFPYMVLNWRSLRLRWRWAAAFAMPVFILTTVIMTGATKHLADLFLMTPWVAWLASRRRLVKARPAGGRMIAVLLSSAVAFATTAVFFGATVAGRSGVNEVFTRDPLAGIEADLEHPLVSPLPRSWQPVEVGLMFYVVHGYYNLSMAMELPFVPCYGAGHSLTLMRYVEKFTGRDSVYDRTYIGRSEANNGPVAGLGRWHTIYPWLASDVSFPGAVFIVFLIGRVVAMCWLDCLRGDNPFAVSLFLYFVIVIFYFSANNQVLQNSYQCVPFYLTLAIWWSTRGRVLDHARASPVAAYAPGV